MYYLIKKNEGLILSEDFKILKYLEIILENKIPILILGKIGLNKRILNHNLIFQVESANLKRLKRGYSQKT